jgi:uncharacterized membrane protein YhaH (DUF805 family)
MNFDSLFVDPRGSTSRGDFVPALLTLLAAVLFYALLVKNRTGEFCLLVLVFPGFVLHARRLHDMGRSAWLLAVPVVLLVAALAIRLDYLHLGAQLDGLVPLAAIILAAAFAVWGCIGNGRAEPIRSGMPAQP